MGSLIRLLAVLAAGAMALSLLLFVIDESSQSSQGQVAKLRNDTETTTSTTQVNAPSPSANDERVRERIHSSAREAIDDANDVLASPFTGLVGDSGSIWAQRLVPGVLGILLYGLGGLMLANFLGEPARQTQDWREAAS